MTEEFKEKCCDCGKEFKEGEMVSGSPVDGYFHANCKTKPKIRQFDSGAYRDSDDNKLDFEACFSPLVLQRYAEYIRSKRKVPIWKDNGVRPDDNWQKGISRDSYIKSKARHFISTWLIHRGFPAFDNKGNKVNLEETLCAELFNTMGYLFEILKKQSKSKSEKTSQLKYCPNCEAKIGAAGDFECVSICKTCSDKHL